MREDSLRPGVRHPQIVFPSIRGEPTFGLLTQFHPQNLRIRLRNRRFVDNHKPEVVEVAVRPRHFDECIDRAIAGTRSG
jgi:hypothetical protein